MMPMNPIGFWTKSEHWTRTTRVVLLLLWDVFLVVTKPLLLLLLLAISCWYPYYPLERFVGALILGNICC